ncbi:hypothetical protein D3C77_786090 [compost metagenome]
MHFFWYAVAAEKVEYGLPTRKLVLPDQEHNSESVCLTLVFTCIKKCVLVYPKTAYARVQQSVS